MRFRTLLAVPVLAVLSIGQASAGVITSEDFTGGASGWTNNTTSFIAGDQVLGGFPYFGVGATTEKTFALSGTQTEVTIAFDFWKGDSWDGETFYARADGNTIYSRQSWYWEGTQQAGQGHNQWNELKVSVSQTYLTTATSLTLWFGSSLDQGAADEWWAVDNVVITDNASSVPEPETAGLLLLALGMMRAVGRRRL